MQGRSMGNRDGEQPNLFLGYQQMRGPSHPFYQAVNMVLKEHRLDEFVEGESRLTREAL